LILEEYWDTYISSSKVLAIAGTKFVQVIIITSQKVFSDAIETIQTKKDSTQEDIYCDYIDVPDVMILSYFFSN
jgi:hypothetical protein